MTTTRSCLFCCHQTGLIVGGYWLLAIGMWQIHHRLRMTFISNLNKLINSLTWALITQFIFTNVSSNYRSGYRCLIKCAACEAPQRRQRVSSSFYQQDVIDRNLSHTQWWEGNIRRCHFKCHITKMSTNHTVRPLGFKNSV